MTASDGIAAVHPTPGSSAPAGDGGQLSLLRNGALLAASAGHGAVDLCANTLPVFYPLLMAAHNLSYAAVAALASLQWTISSLCQPLFGWLADRFGGRVIAILSLLIAFLALALVGFASSYQALLLMAAMLGLGVGAYHPQGARTAAALGGRWRTTAVSIYMIGGSSGFALGPLLAATLLVPAGLRSTMMLLIPGCLMGLLLFATLGRADRLASGGGARAQRGGAGTALVGVVALGVVIVMRSWVHTALVAFLPLLYAARGEPPGLAGQILFLALFSEGVGTAFGGWLADRIGKRATLVASFLLLAPAVHLFLGAGGPAAVALAPVVGLLTGCSTTITLVAAQEVLPSRVAMASGLAISLSNIMGGIAVGGQGVVADRFGLEPSLRVLAIAALVGAGASLGVGSRRSGVRGQGLAPNP